MVSGEGLVRLSLRFAVVWPVSRPLSCVVVVRALQVFGMDDEKNEAKPAILLQTWLWCQAGPLLCRLRVGWGGGGLAVGL